MLQRLELTPEQCVWCDLYWVFRSRLIFVSICGEGVDQPSVGYWKQPSSAVPYRFVASTRNVPLTKAKVEIAVRWIADWLKAGGDQNIRKLNGTSGICDRDIVVD